MKLIFSLFVSLFISLATFAQNGNGIYLFGFMENTPDYPVVVDVSITTNTNEFVYTSMLNYPNGNFQTTFVPLPESSEFEIIQTAFFNCDSQYVYNTFTADMFPNMVDIPLDLNYCSDSTEVILGCTDPEATNYNPSATEDDDSCEYEATCVDVYIQLDGPSNQEAWWYLSSDNYATEGDYGGSDLGITECLPYGCYTLELYSNTLDSLQEVVYTVFLGDTIVNGGVISTGNSASFGIGESCDSTQVIYGCTDPEAINYNPNATENDGSCEYETDCDLNDVSIAISTQAWGYEISWNLLQNSLVVASGSGYESQQSYISNYCLEDGCYSFEMLDSYGDGWNGATYEILNNGAIIASGTLPSGSYGLASFGINEVGCEPVIYGCTDPQAINYNPNATEDDGSCEYFTYAENDLCEDATPLLPGTILLDNTNAIQNENIWGECWGFGQGEGEQTSVWYTFTTPDVPASIEIEALYDGTNTLTDTQFGIFETCGGEMIYCDGNGGEGLMSRFDFACGELAENTTYLLLVDGWNGDNGTCYLNFTVDTTCAQEVLGCTDPLAINYNPLATQDDGSCEYETTCTEVTIILDGSSSFEADWLLASDNGYFEGGSYLGSDLEINECLEDGCYELFFGTNDSIYEVSYTVFIENQMVAGGIVTAFESGTFSIGSGCDSTTVVYGCTDPEAINYNPNATDDDGSCEYETSCEENEITILVNTNLWGEEITWNVVNSDSVEVAGGGGYDDNSEYYSEWCLSDGCYTFEMFDSYGDGWNGGSYEVYLGNSLLSSGTLQAGSYGSISFGINTEGCEELVPVYGCMDSSAINYNPNATIDDGSCIYQFDCSIDFLVVPDSTGEEIIWIIPTQNIFAATDVLWDFGDGTTSTDLFPSHQYDGDGPFTLCVTATFTTSDSSTCSIIYCVELSGQMVGGPGFGAGSGFTINIINNIVLGVEEAELITDLSLWPNPTSDQLNIRYNNVSNEIQIIDILDITGKVVIQKQLGSAVGEVNNSISLNALPSGIYLLRLSTSDFSKSKRFVISK